MGALVIVGAGMAAYGLAREFRKLDRDRPVQLISADSAAAYAKPMLSNAFALGKDAAQLASADAAKMAAQLGIEIVPHTTVRQIDVDGHRILTDRGAHGYGALVLALGAQPIRLPLAGAAADEVLSVNHLDDYALFRTRLAAAGERGRVVILGAGLIGCEFADDLSGAGHHVTLVDPNPRPLAALAAPGLSGGLLQAWGARPIAFEFGATATGVERGAGGRLQVALSNGHLLEADVVLSAIGLRPELALAQSAGLATGRGITIDRFGRTSAPDIYALGDCVEYAAGADGAPAVLPYIAPMLVASRALAATLAGTPTAIELKAEPVTVKTPCYRLMLLPPPRGVTGNWNETQEGERTVCRFMDEQGRMRGFGLSQPTAPLRQQLLDDLYRSA